MAGRSVTKHMRRRGAVAGGALSAFAAAAALATGSAAPAHADIDALIDPIIAPIVSSLTAFDPAAAVDLTSWTDSLLSSFNSLDLALPAAADPSSAVAAAAEPAASTTGTYDLPITVLEDTEPTVNAAIDGSSSSVPLLVDTGSSGLVLPYTDFGSNFFSQLEALYALGTPTGISESGYSGGVEYVYLTYNDVPITYADGLSTDGPVDVEIYSYDPSDFSSYFTNDAFQNFLTSNDVSGILGVGENTAGPATSSPFESFGGVLVDIPDKELVLSSTNPLSSYASFSGDPISTSALTETVTNAAGGTVGTGPIYDDLDSGGVYGTIPSSIASSVPAGDTVSVYDGSQLLYSYVVGTDSLGNSTAPTAVSGIGTSVSNSVDSGVVPFLTTPIYIDYANDSTYFDTLASS